MMRYVIAGVIIVCLLIILWPVMLSAGRKLVKYFQQANDILEGGESTDNSAKLQSPKQQSVKKTKSNKTTSKRAKKSTVKKRK